MRLENIMRFKYAIDKKIIFLNIKKPLRAFLNAKTLITEY